MVRGTRAGDGEHSQGFRPWRRAGLIGAVTLLAAVVAVPGTHADIPYPDDDPFYTAPISLGSSRMARS